MGTKSYWPTDDIGTIEVIEIGRGKTQSYERAEVTDVFMDYFNDGVYFPIYTYCLLSNGRYVKQRRYFDDGR